MSNKITVALMRDLEKKVLSGEISYSRMVEILNETAAKNHDQLDELLGGEKLFGESSGFSPEEVLSKHTGMTFDSETYLIQTHFDYVIRAMKEYADLQTSALRKQLDGQQEIISKQMDLTGAIAFGEWIANKLQNSWFKHGWQGWYLPNKSKHVSTEELYNEFLKHPNNHE